MNETLYVVTLILYLIPCLSSLSNIKIIKNYNALIGIGFITHALLIFNNVFNQGVDLSFANSTLLLSWIIVGVFILLNKNLFIIIFISLLKYLDKKSSSK